jgi:Na+/H+-dicarboxylate symporter
VKKIFKNYKSTIILLLSIIIGGMVGLIFKEKASVLNPFGTIFLNLMFVIIVPLIFLTITTSIAKIKEPKRLGKIMTSIVVVFIVTSLISCIVGLLTTYSFELVSSSDSQNIKDSLEITDETNEVEELNILERTADVLTVNDFSKILSKDNLIAVVVFSILIGLAINKCKEEAKPLLNILESAKAVCLKFVEFAMLYAPIGLGCYFASLIGTYGSSIAIGYLKTFIIYTVVAIIFYLVIYTIYAYIAAGKKGVKSFWLNIIPATVTSLSTCSSAASIPVNIECSKKIGVSDDIAETIIPLGTSFHKDGSVIGSVFKIMFLAYLFGTNLTTASSIAQVVITALIANLLVVAVPIGGGTISEMLILSMMNYPVAALPILTVVATIIDAPATVLNVVGDTSSSMLVARIVDGKNWLKESK